jgi:hypothetical protein
VSGIKEVAVSDEKLGPILFDIPGDIDYDKTFLQDLGHRVMVCHGPEHATLCPILAGAGCELAEAAHGIIFALDLDRPQHRAILKRYREVLRDDVAMRVVVKPEQAEQYADLLRGLRVWTHQPAAGDFDALAAEVEAAET